MAALTIPILPSADFDVTSSFYGALGFEEVGRWASEYLILRHPDFGVELHFWFNATADRWTNDAACYVRFTTPQEALGCHDSWAQVAIDEPAALSPPQDGPAPGSVEFHLIDNDGNLLRLGGFAP